MVALAVDQRVDVRVSLLKNKKKTWREVMDIVTLYILLTLTYVAIITTKNGDK
jgi:hypothetical protein